MSKEAWVLTGVVIGATIAGFFTLVVPILQGAVSLRLEKLKESRQRSIRRVLDNGLEVLETWLTTCNELHDKKEYIRYQSEPSRHNIHAAARRVDACLDLDWTLRVSQGDLVLKTLSGVFSERSANQKEEDVLSQLPEWLSELEWVIQRFTIDPIPGPIRRRMWRLRLKLRFLR